jgi:hypothetical protein
MRYDPATYAHAARWANTLSPAAHQPISASRLGDRDGAMRREAAELDVWEDEDGTSSGHAPEFSRRQVAARHDIP